MITDLVQQLLQIGARSARTDAIAEARDLVCPVGTAAQECT